MKSRTSVRRFMVIVCIAGACGTACAQQGPTSRSATANMVEAQAPREIQDLIFFERLRTLTPEEAGAIAVFFDSPEYYIVSDRAHLDVADSKGLTWLGEWFGEPVTQQHLKDGRRGAIINLTGGSVSLRLHGADVALSSKGILYVEALPQPEADPRGGPEDLLLCNVTGCDGINYSACCVYGEDGKNTCKCLPNEDAQPDDCDAGGPSATGCSLP